MNFQDARTAQQAQELAPPPCFIDDKERRAHPQSQARLLRADMDEHVVAEWRRTHPEEATAEYEF